MSQGQIRLREPLLDLGVEPLEVQPVELAEIRPIGRAR
jgi:hypothetical protein